jgi:hypothetical protein
MLTGYARVSTDDQDTAAQGTALKAAGCERIYREKDAGTGRNFTGYSISSAGVMCLLSGNSTGSPTHSGTF